MKRQVCVFLTILILFSFCCNAYALEPNWKSLYSEKITQITSEYKSGIRSDENHMELWGDNVIYFALADINFDGVPELYHTLCSYFEHEPATLKEFEEIYYIKNGLVLKGTIEAESDLGLLPMYAGRVERDGALYEYNSRWQYVLRNTDTEEYSFVVNDSYSGFMDVPERRVDRLIFDAETGILKAENMLYQEIDSYTQAEYISGYEFVSQGLYNSYSSDSEYNINNWKAGYIAPKMTWMGENILFDVPPVIVNGRTLVPIRKIAQMLGAVVSWDESTQNVKIEKDGNVLVMTINKNEYSLNGEAKTMDVPAKIMSGRTMVPVRVVSENLDCHVQWDADMNMVKLTK